MARKSSKTAHVLNLLTTGAHDDVLEDTAQEIASPKNEEKQKEKPQPAKKQAAEAEPVNKAEAKAEPPKPAEPEPAAPPLQQVTEEPIIEPEPVIEPEEPAGKEPEAKTELEPSLPIVVEQQKPIIKETPAEPQEEIPPAEPKHDAEQATAKKTIVNIAEISIAEKIDDVINRMNVCKCDLCRKDIMALALNNAPARYVAEENVPSILVSQYDNECGREVVAALVKACIKIKTQPRHN